MGLRILLCADRAMRWFSLRLGWRQSADSEFSNHLSLKIPFCEFWWIHHPSDVSFYRSDSYTDVCFSFGEWMSSVKWHRKKKRKHPSQLVCFSVRLRFRSLTSVLAKEMETCLENVMNDLRTAWRVSSRHVTVHFDVKTGPVKLSVALRWKPAVAPMLTTYSHTKWAQPKNELERMMTWRNNHESCCQALSSFWCKNGLYWYF